MRAREGGALFGFCPGKATWYPDVVALYRMLTACVVYKQMPYEGGVMDQPDWIVALLAEFGPKYEAIQWSSRMRNLFGGGSGKPGVKPNGSDNRGIVSKGRR